MARHSILSGRGSRAVCAAVLLTAGCTAANTPGHRSASPTLFARSDASSAHPCPVTAPTQAGVPAAIRAQTDDPVFGNGRFWVSAWWMNAKALDQVRSGELGNSKYPSQEKFPTWTLVNDAVTDNLGRPRAPGARLNAG